MFLSQDMLEVTQKPEGIFGLLFVSQSATYPQDWQDAVFLGVNGLESVMKQHVFLTEKISNTSKTQSPASACA